MNTTKPKGRGAGIRRASAGRSLGINADPATLRRLGYAALVIKHLTGTHEGNATMMRAAVKLLCEYLSQHLECANPANPYCPEVGQVRVLMNRAAQGETLATLRWPESLLDESGEPMTLDELHEAGKPRGRFGLRELDSEKFPGEEPLTGDKLDAALAAELRQVAGVNHGA